MSGIPQIYDSFEEWLANPRDDNTSMKFKPDYSPPENSNEAFKRYGIAGESFFNAMKEAQYQPKMVNGNVEVKYNRAFNNIDTNKAWQLWEDNGAPIVKDKGSSSLLAREESTAPKFTPLEMGKINKVDSKEIERLVKEITEEAKRVVEDYTKNKSELSGSITQVHQDSPLLKEE